MNELIKAKAELKKQMAHGDLARAANEIGCSRQAVRQWILAERPFPAVDARNIRAMAKVIKQRKSKIKQAMRAISSN